MIRRYQKPRESFWITNISKKAQSLYDLNLTIMPLTSIDLLSKNHNITKQQAINSATSGSIFKRSDAVVVRKVPPDYKMSLTLETPFDRNIAIPSRAHSAVKVENIEYDELNISDEDYAKAEIEAIESNDQSQKKK